MGIKYFYSQWIKKNKFKDVDIQYIPGNYLYGLSIDMNGLFHDIATKTYGYLDQVGNIDTKKLNKLENSTSEALLLEFYENLTNKLLEILKYLKPSFYLILAVDGVAPPAKINQQRSRRYKSALELSKSGNKSFFDKTSITPGTDFMNKLDEYLLSWLETNSYKLPELIIYSSHRLIGEGEHKIYHLLKYYSEINEIKQSDLYHGVYGLDADLVMLSCLSNIENIVLIRNDYQNIVNIKKLRAEIILKLTYGWDAIFNPKIIIQDYVIMVFLIGNDFLPSILALEEVYQSLDVMFKIYNALRQNFTDINGQITWTNLNDFLNILINKNEDIPYLGETEKKFLVKKACKGGKNKLPELNSVLDLHPNKSFIQNLNYWDPRTNDPRFSDEFIVKEPFTNENFLLFRHNWYSKIFNPSFPLKSFTTFFEQDVTAMCNDYILGIQWVLGYYMGISITNNYIYNYLYAPLLYDIFITLDSNIDNNKLVTLNNVKQKSDNDEFKLNFMYQLVSVIPPQSANLIHKKYRHLIVEDGNLSYMCPLDFNLDFAGKKNDFEAIAILPYLNLQKIKQEVDNVSTKHERGKNEGGEYFKYYIYTLPAGFTFNTIHFVKRNFKHKIKPKPKQQEMTEDTEPIDDENSLYSILKQKK